MTASAAEPYAPKNPLQRGSARIDALLRSASLLLALGNELDAVRALHAQIDTELGRQCSSGPLPYASRSEAEEEHRRLCVQINQQCARTNSVSWRQHLHRHSPMWASWAIVVAVAGGLVLRYAYALLERTRWQHEYPHGAWISRYYSDPDFKNFLLMRYDVAVNYKWGKRAPAQAMARDQWSATWDTCVMAAAPLTLTLQLIADDAGRLILDGSEQIRVRGRRTKSALVSFTPGMHHLRVAYQERRRGSKLQLQGLDFNGTDAYRFQRPRLEGEEVRCELPAQ